MKLSFLCILLIFSVSTFGNELPIGMLCTTSDPDFEEFRYEEQIPYCKRSVSRRLKTALYKEYGISSNDRSSYYIDHIIPLSIGGSNQKVNLVPIKDDISTSKIEFQVYQWLKNGHVKQKTAVKLIFDFKKTLLCD